MRLLNTRPTEDAASLTAALKAMGHQVLAAPLLEIADIAADLPDLAACAGLLATSANGIRAFARKSDERKLPVYAVGDATARCAREAGFVDVKTASGDVQALAVLVKESCQPEDGALLHVAGTRLAGDLGGDLTAAGYDVQRLVMYQARTAESLPEPVKKTLAAGDLDGVMLYSPRTAATFVALVQAAGLEKACAAADVWCLSQAVANQAHNLPWRSVQIAGHPEQASLLDLLANQSVGET